MEELISFVFACLDVGSWVAYFCERDDKDKDGAERADDLESRPRPHPCGDRSD